MTEPLLELRGLAKAWRSFRLDSVDLVLPPGLVLGLVGANGAGKTTLLRMVMGLVRPTAGSVRLLGRDLAAGGPALRRRIAFVPDEPRWPEEVRLEALASAHARFHPDWDGGAWRELMADFGLDPRLRAGQLSLGMRTRFALTLALSRPADLLLLDEPTTGLDPVFRRELLERLGRFVEDGSRSILFSTHITSDLERRADLVTLLRGGRLQFTLDQEALRETWVVVRGGPELLDADLRGAFRGLRETPHGFEGLWEGAGDAHRRFGDRAEVAPASLEDLVVLMGRRRDDAA